MYSTFQIMEKIGYT